MVEIGEFCAKLQAILNGTASEVSALTRPDFSVGGVPVYFGVRSPSLPYHDDITDKAYGNVAGAVTLPVMVEQPGTGQYEAYPDLGLWNDTFQINFMFPVAYLQDIRLFYKYLADAVVGKIIAFGTVSGSACCTVGSPSFGQMRYLEAYQLDPLKAEASKIFGQSVCVSREWASLTLPFYMSGANGLNESDGLLFANQVTDTLTMQFPDYGITHSEVLKRVSPSLASSSLTYEQQGMGKDFQKGLVTNTAYGGTFTVFVSANTFWLIFLREYRKGIIQKSTNVRLTTSIPVGGSPWFASDSADAFYDCIIKDVSFSYEYGKPVTCTFTLEPKATAGTV